MTKLHDLIKHLQEYEERFGDMPVYLSVEVMNMKKIGKNISTYI